jgi:hypothetical protein
MPPVYFLFAFVYGQTNNSSECRMGVRVQKLSPQRFVTVFKYPIHTFHSDTFFFYNAPRKMGLYERRAIAL